MKLKLISLWLTACLLTACGVQAAFNANAEDVAGAAAEIAEFDVPVGFAPEYVAEIQGYTVISYRPDEGDGHLYLLQAQDTTDADSLEDALTDMVPGQKDVRGRMTVLETRSLTVREKPATLVVSKGTNGDGESYVQATLLFEGKTGPALLAYSEPSATWDLTRVESLVGSIR